MIDITLTKAKYRNSDRKVLKRQGLDPAEGTLVYLTEAHSYRSRTGNNHGPTPKRSKGSAGKGNRKRQGGPF